jgi:predicted  nucleic acid-binding Zn-ribbon protein
MTEKSLWQQIKEVVDCDKAIAVLRNDIKAIELDLAKDRQQGTIRENITKDKQRAIQSLQKELQLKELDAKDLKAKEDRKRVQHDHAQGQKEYMALEREIAMLGKERAAIEEHIVKQWYNLDLLKADLDTFQAGRDAEIAALEQDIKVKEEKLAHCTQELAKIMQVRELAVQQVEPDIRAQYERMHNNVPDPIVPVLNASCSACFYAVSPQNLIRLKHADVLICRNCYRFLYYDSQLAEEATKGRSNKL